MSTVETPTTPVEPDSLRTQFLRYLVVGGIAFAVDFGVLTLLSSNSGMGLDPLVSAPIAFICGLIVNYVLSIAWVFTARSFGSPMAEFIVFTIIGVVGMGWTELLMYLGDCTIGKKYYQISKLIAVAVVLVWNFGMRKILLFSRSKA